MPTSPHETLAAVFAEHRPRLRALAYRVLGSHWNTEDAVQETWLRFQRADADSIENVEAWLTTVVSRVCIDQLRKQQARHEEPAVEAAVDRPAADATGPEAMAVRADQIGAAMQLVLEFLNPLERLSFVLHDVFGLAFDEIAPIIGRSSANARQLASRARRRIRAVDATAERAQRREAVEAFLSAARDGNFGHLLQLLDPEVELRSDDAVVALTSAGANQGAPLLESSTRGADAVARVFAGRAELAQTARVDGLPALVYAPSGTAEAVYLIHFAGGRITRIDAIADPRGLSDLTITLE